MPGLVRALFISKRDQPHRTRDWVVPFVARRLLELQLQLQPCVGARQRRARRHHQRHRIPCREDSVIPFSLFPFSTFHFLWDESAAFAAEWHHSTHPLRYGQIVRLQHSDLPVNKGGCKGFQLRSTFLGLCAAWGYLECSSGFRLIQLEGVQI